MSQQNINKNKLWGPATWYLFHTLAEKIDEKHFKTHVNTLLNIVTSICQILPCPDCASHATMMLSKYRNFHLIKTKIDFQRFLFEFHNIVNKKTGKVEYSWSDIDFYKNGNLTNIVNYWVKTFRVFDVSRKTMTDNIGRANLGQYVKTFVNTHPHIFINPLPIITSPPSDTQQPENNKEDDVLYSDAYVEGSEENMSFNRNPLVNYKL